MSTVDRGYGYAHMALRERWRPRVEAGAVACSHPWCGLPILPGEKWDLAHDPADRTRWAGPQHARCNRDARLVRRMRGRRRFHWRNPDYA